MSWQINLTTPNNNATGIEITPLLSWQKTESTTGGNPIAVDFGTGIASPYVKTLVLSDGKWWNQVNPGTFTDADTDQIISDAVDITGASTGITIKPYGWADRLDSGLTLNQLDSEIPNKVAESLIQQWYNATAYIEISGLPVAGQYDIYLYGGRSSNYSATYRVSENGNSSNNVILDAKNTVPPALILDLPKLTCTADANGKVQLDFFGIDAVYFNAMFIYPAMSSAGTEPNSSLTVSLNPDLSAPLIQSALATETSYQVATPLTESTNYYWGVSIDGGTTYNDIWKFTTKSNNPFTSPTLLTPGDNATDISLLPTLTWYKTDAATLFDIDLSTTPTFSGTQNVDFLRWEAQSGESFTVPTTLIKNTTYYWRVRSTDNSQYVSEWSTVSSFTTQYGIPDKPILTSPTAGVTGVSTTNTFLWTNGGGAETYDLYVSTSSDFPEGVVAADLTTINYDGTSLSLNNSTGYYWKVVAKNSYGTNESIVESFVTANPNVPDPPTLKSPLTEISDVYLRPVYEWNESPNAISYDIEVSDNSSFNNSSLSIGNTGTSFTSIEYLTPGIKYYWRVRAVNANGTGAWSAANNFTTQPDQTTNTPTGVSPVDNATEVSLTPTLNWDWTAISNNTGTNYGAFPDIETRSIQSIVVKLSSPATVFNITKAALKYNKRFAASYSGDDSMQADMDSFQQNIRDGGAAYTDGCGNNIPFGLDFANYSINSQDFDFHTEDDTWSSSWYSWSQMAEAYEWGSGIFSHGYKDPIGWGGSVENDVLKSKSQIYKQLMKRPEFEGGVINGVDEQYFCAPDSNEGYYSSVIKPIGQYNPYKGFLSETTSSGFIGHTDGVDVSAYSDSSSLTKLFRSFSAGSDWLASAKNNSINGHAYWVLYGGHGVSASHISDALPYGSTGSDDILFASAQEVLDYIDVRGKTVVNNDLGTTGNDSVVTITMDTSLLPNDLRFYGLTLLVDTDATIESITINGGIASGFRKNSYNITGNSAMVNVHWNGKEYLSRAQTAQRWVDWAISKGSDQYVKSIAQDYIDCVPAGAERDNLLSQLSLSDSGWNTGSVFEGAGINYDPENLPMQYDIQIAPLATPNTPILNLSGISGNTYTVQSGLTEKTEYIWKIKADNAVYTSDWNTLMHFTTIYGKPDIPTISFPTDGATGVDTSISLQFSAGGLVDNYDVEVSTDSGFTTTVVSQTGVASPYALPTLQENTIYYCRVRSVNSYGSSNWSLISFTTKLPAVPDPPVYLVPSSGATSVPITGQSVQWEANTNTDTYDIEVRISDPGGANDDLIIDTAGAITATSFDISPVLSYSTTYKWRVRGNNISGAGSWGSYWYFTTAAIPLPDKVVLTSPADVSIDISLSPLFSWEAATYATAYKLEISTDKTNFDANVIYTYDYIATTSFDLSQISDELLYSTQYYWRVKSYNNSGYGTPSDVSTFTTVPIPTPQPPVLVSPDDAATGVSKNPSLKWQSSDADTFSILIAKAADGFTNAVEYTATSQSYTLITALDFSTEYIWKVAGINNSGKGDYSTVRAFTTETAPIQVLVTGSPEGLDIPISNLTFTWEKGNSPVSYHLVLTRDSDGAIIVDDNTISTNSYDLQTTLDYNSQYVWTVIEIAQDGSQGAKGTFVFTTVDSGLPLKPIITSPVNNSTDNQTNVLIDWGSDSKAETFELQIATDSAFTNINENVSNLTSSMHPPANLQNESTYYVRVRGSNTIGIGEWSDTVTFSTTVNLIAGTPILSSPNDTSVISGSDVTFEWNTVANADSYTLQVSLDGTFTSINNEIANITTNLAVVNSLQSGAQYYWRVKAINQYGDSDYSTSRSFTMGALTKPAAPVVTSPANDATDVSPLLTITWDAVTDGNGYDYQIGLTETDMAASNIESTTNNRIDLSSTGMAWGSDYYFRVRGKNTAYIGDWSTTLHFKTKQSNLTAAALTSPANNATGVVITESLLPLLATVTVHNTDDYAIFELASDSAFTNVIDSETINFTGRTLESDFIMQANASPSTLLYSTQYYWRVTVYNAWTSIVSDVFNFTSEAAPDSNTPPVKPVLLLPIDNSEVIETAVTIEWEGSIYSDTYDIQVSTDSTFTNVTKQFNGIVNTNVTVGSLLPETIYYWRVKGVNSLSAGEYSNTWSFKIKKCCKAPEIISPSNYMYGIKANPIFQWTRTEESTGYELEVSLNEYFDDLIISLNDIKGESVIADTKLNYQTTYYWRVRARKQVKDNVVVYSEYSTIGLFTVESYPVPQPIEIISPTSGQVLSTNATINFTKDEYSYSYQIQVSKNPAFVACIYDFITDVNSVNLKLIYNTNYFIKIRGVGVSGIGEWSDVVYFKTELLTNNNTPTNMDLLIKTTFNLDTGMMSVADGINSDYNTVHGLSLSEIKGLFKITGENGIIYENTGFREGNYINPDIVGNSNKWQLDNITLPEDANGKVIEGEYVIEYKLTADGTDATTYTGLFGFLYTFKKPVGSIHADIDVLKSKMTVTDATDYTVKANNKVYFPENDLSNGDRIMTVRFPLGSNIADVTSNLGSFKVSPIWTGNYDILLNSVTHYLFPQINTGIDLEVITTIKALDDTHKVELYKCASQALACVQQIAANYEIAKINNLRRAASLKYSLDEIMVYYNMYEMAIKHGGDTEYPCAKLNKLITNSGYIDSEQTDTVSKQVIPIV